MNKSIYPIVLFGVISVALFAPFLFGSVIFADGDAVTYTYPYAFLYSKLTSQWNSYVSGGMPVISTFHFGYFSPVYMLFFGTLDFLNAYHLILLINLFLSFLLTYLFALNLKFNKAESILVAITYALNSHNLSLISAINISHVSWILPALFLSIDKVISGGNRYSILIAISIGYGFLGSHYQFLILSVLFSIVYFCFRCYEEIKDGKTKKDLLSPLLYLFIGFLISVLIGFPQLINTYEFTKLSIRSDGTGFLNTTATGITPIDLFAYIFPAFGLPLGLANGFLSYIGILGLILLIIGIKNLKFADKQRLFFVATFVFLLLSAFKYSPLYLLIYYIPPMMFFRISSRVIFVANFLASIIVGYGARDLLFNFEQNKKIFYRLLISISVFLIFVSIFATIVLYFKQPLVSYISNYFDANLYQHTTKQPLGYYHSLIEKMYDTLFSSLNFSNPMILITLFLCISVYFIFRKELVKKEQWISVFIIGSLMNLMPTFYFLNNFTDRKLIDENPKSAQIIREVEKTSNDYRVTSFLFPYVGYTKITALSPKDIVDQYEFVKEGMVPNLNIFYDVNILNGYEPMVMAKKDRLFKEIFIDEKKIPVEQKLKFIQDKIPLLSMLNVKFLIMPFPLSDQGLSLVSEYKSTKYNLPVYIYENKKFIPKIYIAKNPKCFTDENDLFDSMLKRTDSTVEDAYILYDSCEYFNNNNKDSKVDKFVIEAGENVSNVTTKSDSSIWLIFSESGLPGWKITIDGVNSKVYNANYLFQAVNVPPGDHTVRFIYENGPTLLN